MSSHSNAGAGRRGRRTATATGNERMEGKEDGMDDVGNAMMEKKEKDSG